MEDLEAIPVLSGTAATSASPGLAEFERDSGDLLAILAELENLFEPRRTKPV